MHVSLIALLPLLLFSACAFAAPDASDEFPMKVMCRVPARMRSSEPAIRFEYRGRKNDDKDPRRKLINAIFGVQKTETIVGNAYVQTTPQKWKRIHLRGTKSYIKGGRISLEIFFFNRPADKVLIQIDASRKIRSDIHLDGLFTSEQYLCKSANWKIRERETM